MLELTVSAIITSYNRSISFLGRAVDSVKKQTYKNIEIIVVDDNPIDSIFSLDIKNYCKRNNIKYIKQFGNQGACVARNLGVANSSGEYIAFLDDDDIWLPSKIEEQVKYLCNGYDLVFCQGITINVSSKQNFENIYGNAIDFLICPSFQDMLIKNKVGTTSQIIIKRACFFDINGFDEKFLSRQDYDLCLRVSKKYKLYGVEKILFKHYLHNENQISKSASNSLQGYKLLYEKYKKYYKKNKLAFVNICCKISKSYKHTGNGVMWFLYIIKAFLRYPSKGVYIIQKASDKKIV